MNEDDALLLALLFLPVLLLLMVMAKPKAADSPPLLERSFEVVGVLTLVMYAENVLDRPTILGLVAAVVMVAVFIAGELQIRRKRERRAVEAADRAEQRRLEAEFEEEERRRLRAEEEQRWQEEQARHDRHLAQLDAEGLLGAYRKAPGFCSRCRRETPHEHWNERFSPNDLDIYGVYHSRCLSCGHVFWKES